MKHRLLAGALAAALFLPLAAEAAGRWNVERIGPGQQAAFIFGGSDQNDAQPPLQVPPGPVWITAEIGASAVSVSLYGVAGPGSDTPASVGQLLATITADTRTPLQISVGPGQVLEVDIDTDGDGGTIYVAAAGLGRTNITQGALAGASVSSPATGSYLACDTSLGVCGNPRSTLLLDTRIFFAAAKGGVRDDDGSMWTGPGTANNQFDFINSSAIVATAAGGTAYILTSSVADAFDLLSCRDTVTFAECSTGATCVSNIEAIADPEPWTWCDVTTGLCYGASATSYAGCNTSTHNLTTLFPRPVTNAGTAQLAMPDGVHPSSQLAKLIAQSLLAATVELLEWPVSTTANLIANGHATTDATGWSDVGLGTTAADAAEVIPADFQNANWYNGGVQLTGRTLATDVLLTPTMTTVSGRWYVAKGFARLNSTGTEDIVVQAIDASLGTALATQATYQVHGSQYETLASGTSSRDRQCYGGCYFIVKFLASDTDIQISIGSNAGTGNVYADDWVAMEAATSQVSLTPLFPANGGIAMRVEGDSRANELTDLAGAIETAIAAGVPRAGFALLDDLFPGNTMAISGRTAQSLVTQGYPTITLATSGGRYVIVQLGVNDVGSRTPAQVASDYEGIADQIRKVGGRPIFVLESPYRGNTTLTSCEGGVENCTTTIDELADLLKHSTTGILH